MNWSKATAIFAKVIDGRSFNKIIFSKSVSKDVCKTEARLFEKKQQCFLQLAHYKADNKVVHENIAAHLAPERLIGLLHEQYCNCVIITGSGNCDFKRTDSGKLVITNKMAAGTATEIAGHDLQKPCFIGEDKRTRRILSALGLADAQGYVWIGYNKLDKKDKDM